MTTLRCREACFRDLTVTCEIPALWMCAASAMRSRLFTRLSWVELACCRGLSLSRHAAATRQLYKFAHALTYSLRFSSTRWIEMSKKFSICTKSLDLNASYLSLGNVHKSVIVNKAFFVPLYCMSSLVVCIRVLIGPYWQRHLHQIRLLCRRRVQMPRLLPHRWTSQRAAVCAVQDPQPTDGVSQRARRLTSIPIKARPHPGADILRGRRFSGRQSRRLLSLVCLL